VEEIKTNINPKGANSKPKQESRPAKADAVPSQSRQ